MHPHGGDMHRDKCNTPRAHTAHTRGPNAHFARVSDAVRAYLTAAYQQAAGARCCVRAPQYRDAASFLQRCMRRARGRRAMWGWRGVIYRIYACAIFRAAAGEESAGRRAFWHQWRVRGGPPGEMLRVGRRIRRHALTRRISTPEVYGHYGERR